MPLLSRRGSIGPVWLHMAQGIPGAVVLDELRVHRADVDPGVVEILGDLLIVPPSVLQHHPCLTVQTFQVVCQLLDTNH